ncbi:hypothetical protein DXG01_004033 [Tephrocybe rancida]|nr:hypothetical protein DXG01_004033 [Tephrocybe rancida]
MREDLDKERRLNVPPNRHTAFLKAMEVIGGLKYEITNAEMVQNAKKDKIIAELTTIEGLTARRAIRLIDAGCGSKEDLNDPKFFNLLTKALQVNVKYDSHLAQPVTHEQTERFADFLRNQLSSSYEIIPVGS